MPDYSGPKRREVLGELAASPAVGMASTGSATPASDSGGRSGLIVRELAPRNLESPLGSLGSFVTANSEFYVRSHFEVPQIDASTWRLKVEGAVRNPFEMTFHELRRLPAESKVALLECAGNGRVFLVPKAKGLLWESGAVGNAEWTGVPLKALLARAGVKAEAVEVILEGADSGKISDEPQTPGVIPYARSLNLGKAMGDVLLAYLMNGDPLSPSHGYPVRAVVPGWYGMASVKWLSRIVVTEKPFFGYFQTLDYATFEQNHGLTSLTAVTGNAVKSQITSPLRGAVVGGGRDYSIKGVAWAGEANVSRVEFSTDGGKTWSDARLSGEPVRHAWRQWEATWRVPGQSGEFRLMARATDDQGRTQPMHHNPNHRTYMIHHVVPVEVEVRPDPL